MQEQIPWMTIPSQLLVATHPTHKEARLLGECETKLGQQLAMKCGKRAIVAFTCVKEFRAADSLNDGGLLHSIRYNWARRRI